VNVVYARENSNQLTLVSDIYDNVIEQELIKKTSPFLYHNRSFTSDDLLREQQKFNRAALETMQKNGVSSEFLASKKEEYQVEESGIEIKNWNDWTNYFKALILDPPISFEKGESFSFNYNNAIAAFHSYVYASYIGDGAMLLKYADPSGTQFLKSLGVSYTNSGNYDFHNAMTHVTILLTASNTFEGRDYSLVLWRGQNSKNPQNGYISLQKTIFVKQNGIFLMTRDLNDSYFSRVIEVANVTGGVWKYSEFKKAMDKSQFPRSFYDFP